ncbi:MAG: effector-associated domain EAD1-containing protein [Caldilineaceae bacterium]
MDERQALAQLRDVLANLYSDVATVRRIVHEAGLNEERIDFSHRAQDSWHAVLREAQKHERVEVLLEIATKEYANNSGLQAAWESYQVVKSKNLTATVRKNQVANKPGRYLVTLRLAIFLMATGLILFVFVLIFQASITKMLMSGNQPVIPTETKTATVKLAEVTATITMSATPEAQALSSSTETIELVGTPTSLRPTITPTITPSPFPTSIPTYPCEAEIVSQTGHDLGYVIRDGPSNDYRSRPFPTGAHVLILDESKSQPKWYHIWSTEKTKQELGWIPFEFLQRSANCPD